jgi:SEL1 protein
LFYQQWARDRRNAEAEQEGDFGPEDEFEGALRAARRGGVEEEPFSETMLLVVLCITVSVLLYIRTRLVERMRRGQEEAAAPNGVFPPPGDPARNEWNIVH